MSVVYYLVLLLNTEKAKHRFSTSDPIPSTGAEADEKSSGKSNYCAEGCESSVTPKTCEDAVFSDTACHSDSSKDKDTKTSQQDSPSQDDEQRSRVMDEQTHNQLPSAGTAVEQEHKTDPVPATTRDTVSGVLPSNVSTNTATPCSGEVSAESAAERTGTSDAERTGTSDDDAQHPGMQQNVEETREKHDGTEDPSPLSDCDQEK